MKPGDMIRIIRWSRGLWPTAAFRAGERCATVNVDDLFLVIEIHPQDYDYDILVQGFHMKSQKLGWIILSISKNHSFQNLFGFEVI